MLIQDIKRALRSKKFIRELNLLRAVCGAIRFKIIFILRYAGRDGLTVTELARILNASLSRTSHQLAILKAHKLIIGTGKNREMVYTLADHRVKKIFNF